MNFSNTDEDDKLRELLQLYIKKLDNDDLSIEEKLNLIEFYVNDPNNFVNYKEFDESNFSDNQIQQFLTMGWLMTMVLENN